MAEKLGVLNDWNLALCLYWAVLDKRIKDFLELFSLQLRHIYYQLIRMVRDFGVDNPNFVTRHLQHLCRFLFLNS